MTLAIEIVQWVCTVVTLLAGLGVLVIVIVGSIWGARDIMCYRSLLRRSLSAAEQELHDERERRRGLQKELDFRKQQAADDHRPWCDLPAKVAPEKADG